MNDKIVKDTIKIAMSNVFIVISGIAYEMQDKGITFLN